MKIESTNVFVGPNMFARFPVIRHILDLGELEHWPTSRLGDEFLGALLAYLPGLHDHGCSYREPGGFIRRLNEDEGTWLGHVMEHVALELQNVAGSDVTFGRTRSIDGRPGFYNMVFQYKDATVGRAAGKLALDLLHSLLPVDIRPPEAPPADWDFAAARDLFIRFAQRREFGPSTSSLVRAAEARNIPWLRLNGYSLVQFGQGRYQQRIQATTTGRTSNIAVELASDKQETNGILRDLGLPVPAQVLVGTAQDAVRAAEKIGYPVVVKPLSGNHGRGVSINLRTAAEVETGFAKASEHGNTIIVESYIEGFDHRLLVVNGKLVAAAKRVPGHVVGDGETTIERLVAIVNEDPRRGVGHEKVLTRLEFDHQAERLLAKLGYDKDTVPATGEFVYLRSTANLSTGGTAIDVTDVIHPDNREMAIRAIRAIDLDIGGVDFLTRDITESYRQAGGGICEVNAGPGFRMHVAPSEGTPRDVAGPVIDMLFPPDKPSRIAIAAVTGTNGKTTTARMLAHILKMSGRTVGLTSTDGVYIDGKLSVPGDMTGPVSAQMILRDPSVDAAVMETARGGMLRSGLGFQECNVAACLNVSSDHLGLRGMDTLEDLAEVKRVPIEIATDAAVLNADDPLCLQMADYTDAARLCYVTMNPSHPLVKQHIQAGGQAFVLEKGMNGHLITIYDKETHTPLVWTHLIPATIEGRALHNVQNAMFAAALAYNMNISLEDIRQGLRTFDSTFFQAPGRMNIYDEHPFRVILDYAHNPAAVRAMCELVDRLDVGGRRLVVLAAPGDRRDEDIRSIAEIAAGHFDHFICRCDDNRRGRGPDEVAVMLKNKLLESGVSADQIEVVPDEQEATTRALELAVSGDLVLILGDNTTRAWKQIIYFNSGARVVDPTQKPAAAVELPDTGDFKLGDDLEIISDERGVRIAREEGD
ncbi:MAG: cyanophycin synthetase [Gammaproteobacteria bacterium]|nr:cyanophycin synthetase [Gammaproteobacteria bacterium]MBT8110163.1 cyanophycin synthetase [Gammaproteobacteria bacterium]NND46935.1 cyanophycin synthetase [Woeseiaceae bacterium]NNL44866.1 cyanophycin synthetase [Woeseiaceae bacterium]